MGDGLPGHCPRGRQEDGEARVAAAESGAVVVLRPVYVLVETLGQSQEDSALGDALAQFVTQLAQVHCVGLQQVLAQRRVDLLRQAAAHSATVNVTHMAATFSLDRCRGSVSWLTDTVSLHVDTAPVGATGTRSVPAGAEVLAHVVLVPAHVDEVALRRIVDLLKGDTDRLLLLYATQLARHLFAQTSRVSRAACVPGGSREMAGALGASKLDTWALAAPNATTTSPAARATLDQLPDNLLPPGFHHLYVSPRGS